VVVGAGQAGGELAAALRLAGYTGEIVVIGEERHLPYSRPPLSKAFLAGEADEDALLLHGADSYAAQGITVHIGHTVRRIDRTGHRVEVAGGWIEYDKLVLATGGNPRRLPDPALAGARNMLTLRTMNDAKELRERLTAGARLAIIGGGYIGLEIAAAARKAGVEVTVLEAADRVLARVTAPVMSEFFQKVHHEEGVRIILGAQMDRFDLNSDGDVTALHLKSGEAIPADCVLVGIGLIPRTELADSSGLATDNGILVDHYMQTSDPDIFAIGDVARHPDPQHGGLRRLESAPNASEQARVVAAAIVGPVREYVALPWFWSDQFDCKLQVAGLATGYDTLIVRHDPAIPRRISTLYLRGGALISADVVNNPAEFAAAKKLITSGMAVDTAALADPAIALRSALIPGMQRV
jgi:3-phenylpropionate/trans-cinnamate dioxygenase ferredoxin reductase subunit